MPKSGQQKGGFGVRPLKKSPALHDFSVQCGVISSKRPQKGSMKPHILFATLHAADADGVGGQIRLRENHITEV